MSPRRSRTKRHRSALALAKLGAFVFPCRVGEKRPATQRGFRDASNCEGEIDRWWSDADYNIGLVPDRFTEPFWILDLDGEVGLAAWEALQAKHARAPATLTVSTPSGGKHLYFVGSAPTTIKRLGPGIDTRGLGGYVLVPPSVVNGKPYEWVRPRAIPVPAPGWLRALLEIPPARPKGIPASFVRDWAGTQTLDYYLGRIGDHEGGEGFYGPMLSAAGAGVRAGLGSETLFDRIAEAARSADHRNHTEADLEKRIAKMPAAIRSFQLRDAARVALPPATELPSDTPSKAAHAEVPLSAAEASARLEELQTGFFAHPTGRRLLIKAPPGLGKTALAIKEGLRHSFGCSPAPDFLSVRWDKSALAEDRQVTFFVPTHKLAGQMGGDVKGIFAKISLPWAAFPVRGRTHGERPLCSRSLEVKALAGKGLPIYRNLCDDGTGARCPHFKKCPYITQKWRARKAELVTATHRHLPTGPCPENDFYWDPRLHSNVWVIDEDPTSSLVQENKTFFRRDIERLRELGTEILTGVAAPSGLLTHLVMAGWTADKLRTAARQQEAVDAKEGCVAKPTDQIDAASLKSFRPLAAVVARLADELASGRGGPAYSLTPASHDNFRAQWRQDLDYDLEQPILITDGTANADILRQWLPDLVEERLSVRRNTNIVQVHNLTFSQNWLLNEGGLQEVARFIAAKAMQYHQGDGSSALLVVTNKKVRCALTAEDPDGKLPISAPALGADIAHFGNLRGVNDFAGHEAVIILGRQQLPVLAAEQRARAIWYDTATPLQFLGPDDKGQVNYPGSGCYYQISDGTRRLGEKRAHPDPRVQAVVEQAREAETLQAIDRLRLIHNPEPKVIYILCSIPLPEIEVDRLVTWEALAGIQRLNEALDCCAAGLAPALPLSPAWLHGRLPDIWETEEAGRSWLREPRVAKLLSKASRGQNANINSRAKPPFETSSAPEPEAISSRLPKITYWRQFKYRIAGRRGGRPSRALVPIGANAVHALATALEVEPEAISIVKQAWSCPSVEEEPRTADAPDRPDEGGGARP